MGEPLLNLPSVMQAQEFMNKVRAVTRPRMGQRVHTAY